MSTNELVNNDGKALIETKSSENQVVVRITMETLKLLDDSNVKKGKH